LKRRAEFWLINAIMWMARLMPSRPGRALFAALGSLACRLLARDRERAIENLGIAFPEADRMLRAAWTRAMFRSLGRNAYEALTLENASPEEVAGRVSRVEGIEILEEAYGRGKGLVAITGHIGCWELMPAYFITRGYRVSVVARRMKVDRVNQRLVSLRDSVGVVTLDRDTSPRAMIAPIRRGEALGVLIDQHTSVAGIYVPFFGRPALTPTAVAKIALMTGAPIMPMAIFQQRDGRHVIHVLPEVVVPEGGAREERIAELTRRCSLAVEQLVRIDPKQWVWFHDRWREPEANDVVVAA
jgi:KDO2-lipid IV(A) lauroyltransferase